MKNQLLSLAFLFGIGGLGAPVIATAASGREVGIDQEHFSKLSAEDQAGVLDLKVRMETLMTTDRSTLTGAQRRELRTQWRAMQHEMNNYNRDGTVIYISTAGLIIIILLLIILL